MKSFVIAMSLCTTVYAIQYPSGFDTNICTPPPNNGGKEIPSLPSEFVADIEFIDYVDKSSIFMTQYLSTTNNIGVMYVNGLDGIGDTYKFITSGDTGEFFLIVDSFGGDSASCRVVNLSETESQSFAFPVIRNKRSAGTFSINHDAVMYRGATPVGPMRYNGTEMMNGVRCDVWYGCLFSPDKKETIAVTFHFSEPSWTTASGYKGVPVRIHYANIPLSGDSHGIGQIYNYAYFSNEWPSTNAEFFIKIFETPEHMYCKDRKSVFAVPSVPAAFNYDAEILDSNKGTVTYVKNFYDYKLNYSRRDYDNGSKLASKMVTEINDFGAGVAYLIDQDTNECTVTGIPEGPFSVSTQNGFVRMKTPEEFFAFDQLDKYPYQYAGERSVRGVMCDNWISIRPYISPDTGLLATYDWYFMTEGAVLKTDGNVEVKKPLQFVTKPSTLDEQFTHNIFKFTQGPQKVDDFNISPCYKDAEKRTFSMRLRGNGTEIKLPINTDLLSTYLRLSIESFAGLRPNRVQNVQLKVSGKYLDTSFTVLDVPKFHGNTASPVQEVTLNMAVNRIRSAFIGGQFTVYYSKGPGSSLTAFSPVQGSLSVTE